MTVPQYHCLEGVVGNVMIILYEILCRV